MSAFLCFWSTQTFDWRRKKVSVEGEEEGNKKKKMKSKASASSSFSAWRRAINGTITSRNAQRREEVDVEEREISLSNGDAARWEIFFFPERRAVFLPVGVRSLFFFFSFKRRSREKKDRRYKTNAHLNGSCSVGVMTNPFSLISFNALVLLCF